MSSFPMTIKPVRRLQAPTGVERRRRSLGLNGHDMDGQRPLANIGSDSSGQWTIDDWLSIALKAK